MNLGGTFSTAGIGNYHSHWRNSINLTGTLDNSGGYVQSQCPLAPGGCIYSGIAGGTVATSGGSVIIANGGTLDGVTLNGEADVVQQYQATLQASTMTSTL